MTDPADLTLVELLPLLEQRSLSARELLDACLVRVDRFDARVKAFVVLTPDLARTAAEAADADRAAGRPTGALDAGQARVEQLARRQRPGGQQRQQLDQRQVGGVGPGRRR